MRILFLFYLSVFISSFLFLFILTLLLVYRAVFLFFFVYLPRAVYFHVFFFHPTFYKNDAIILSIIKLSSKYFSFTDPVFSYNTLFPLFLHSLSICTTFMTTITARHSERSLSRQPPNKTKQITCIFTQFSLFFGCSLLEQNALIPRLIRRILLYLIIDQLQDLRYK